MTQLRVGYFIASGFQQQCAIIIILCVRQLPGTVVELGNNRAMLVGARPCKHARESIKVFNENAKIPVMSVIALADYVFRMLKFHKGTAHFASWILLLLKDFSNRFPSALPPFAAGRFPV
jgi:hypothetical protein